MKICKHCGAENFDDYQYCEICGYRFSRGETSLVLNRAKLRTFSVTILLFAILSIGAFLLSLTNHWFYLQMIEGNDYPISLLPLVTSTLSVMLAIAAYFILAIGIRTAAKSSKRNELRTRGTNVTNILLAYLVVWGVSYLITFFLNLFSHRPPTILVMLIYQVIGLISTVIGSIGTFLFALWYNKLKTWLNKSSTIIAYMLFVSIVIDPLFSFLYLGTSIDLMSALQLVHIIITAILRIGTGVILYSEIKNLARSKQEGKSQFK